MKLCTEQLDAPTDSEHETAIPPSALAPDHPDYVHPETAQRLEEVLKKLCVDSGFVRLQLKRMGALKRDTSTSTLAELINTEMTQYKPHFEPLKDD